MTKENKMKAIELLSEQVCTVEMKAIINGHVHGDMIAITDCCHNAIAKLLEYGFSVSMKDGKLIVDKY